MPRNEMEHKAGSAFFCLAFLLFVRVFMLHVYFITMFLFFFFSFANMYFLFTGKHLINQQTINFKMLLHFIQLSVMENFYCYLNFLEEFIQR